MDTESTVQPNFLESHPAFRSSCPNQSLSLIHIWQLTRLLDEPERKLLLKMADLEDALREEACLNSFISGYRLAQGDVYKRQLYWS